MLVKQFKTYIYAPDVPLRRAVSDLYRKATTICLVCGPDKRLLGVLTLTDIKQALLKGIDPATPLRSIMNKEFVSAPHTASEATLRKLAQQPSRYGTGILEKIPLLDNKGNVAALYIFPQEYHNDETVLVTGGAGYVGSHVCRLLLKKGYRVVVLDKLLFGKQSLKELFKHKKFSFIDGDIGDIGTLIRAVRGVDRVIHLAGIVGDPASALSPMQTMEENHFATKALIDVCKYYGVSRFVFSSSCSVYGAGEELLTEESELRPVSLYAQSKVYAERELLREAGEDFHPVILRFGTLYGFSARMRFDLVANIMSAHAFYSKKITVDGGAQWRPLLHVEDAAAACVAALEAPLEKVDRQIFNVGDTNENYRIEEIAKAAQKAVPAAKIVNLDTVKDRRDYRVSFKKINRVMGWKATRSLNEGVREMVAAFKKKKFTDWGDKRYNNYLTLKSALEVSAAA